MKLSGPQRRAVSKLAQLSEHRDGWTGYAYVGRTNTLDSLVALGLAERRTKFGSLDSEYRVTPRGFGMALLFGDGETTLEGST